MVNTTDCHTGVQASPASSQDSVSKKYNVYFFSVYMYGFLIVGESPLQRSDVLGLRPPGFVGCVCRAVSSDSSHHLQEIIMALFSLYAHTHDLQPCPVTPDLVTDSVRV